MNCPSIERETQQLLAVATDVSGLGVKQLSETGPVTRLAMSRRGVTT